MTNSIPDDAKPSTAHVFMEDTEEDIEWPAGKRLLYAMLDAGLDAPYGCTEGECGACQCVIEPHDNATTHMVHNNVLDEYDIADDMTLACQTVSDAPGGKFDVSYDFEENECLPRPMTLTRPFAPLPTATH